MKTAVLIAYDGLRDSDLRHGCFIRVHSHLHELGWPIWTATDAHKPYRLAFAVNRAIENLHADVILLNYADVLVPHKQIREAVKLAHQEPGQVFAFDQYWFTEEPSGEETMLEDAPANCCMAIQREAFLEVGGYDENFVGWAMEDREFNDRCGRRWPARRVKGRANHLWHGDRREDGSALETSAEQVAANWKHYQGTL